MENWDTPFSFSPSAGLRFSRPQAKILARGLVKSSHAEWKMIIPDMLHYVTLFVRYYADLHNSLLIALHCSALELVYYCDYLNVDANVKFYLIALHLIAL